MRSVGNLPGSALQTYIRGRNSVSTGCYVIRDGRESLSERSFLFIQWDDGQREFVSLFCAPLPVVPFGQCSAAEIALGSCTENCSAAGIPDLARSARGSSETEDGKKST